jgi:hypothetical protein
MGSLIFLINQPLDRRNRKRFGLDYLSTRFEDVGVIDVTKICYPDVMNDFTKRGGVIDSNGINYYCPKSILYLLKFLYQNPKCEIYIDFLGNSFIENMIRASFLLQGVSRVRYIYGVVPEIASFQRGLMKNIKRYYKAHGFTTTVFRLKDAIVNIIFKDFFPPKYVVISCKQAALKISKKILSSANVIYAHTLDYDLYIDIERRENFDALFSANREYGVFLDQDLCFHNDFKYTGISAAVRPHSYFPALLKLFNFINQDLELDLVVATHPRSSYSDDQKKIYFGEHQVIEGNVAALIKGSSFVICHDSTALNLAILWNKPILFITTNDLMQHFDGELTEVYSNKLTSRAAVNLDSEGWQSLSRGVLMEFRACTYKDYKDYKEQYIKYPGSPGDVFFWELFANEIIK